MVEFLVTWTEIKLSDVWRPLPHTKYPLVSNIVVSHKHKVLNKNLKAKREMVWSHPELQMCTLQLKGLFVTQQIPERGPEFYNL